MDVIVKLFTGENFNFKVDKNSFLIGRSGQCDVVIPHESVSRKHCQIDYRDGELYVTDLGSINGVAIDGQTIAPHRPVKFQQFFPLSFGAVQSLLVDIPEERTTVQINPLLATTLPQQKPTKPLKIQNIHPAEVITISTKTVKKLKDDSMKNFVALCVFLVLGFAVFIFRDELMSLLE